MSSRRVSIECTQPFETSIRKGSMLATANAVHPDRKPSSFGTMTSDRRRSSVSCFLDYEATTKAFLDAQVKLGQNNRLLAELEAKNKELQQNYESLHRRFMEVKTDALECTLGYILDKSKDFKYLPHLNQDLLETESRIGEYVVSDVINKGQFSTVKRGAKFSARGGKSRKNTVTNLSFNFAIKVISKDNLTSVDSVLWLENELRALTELQHPNIIGFVEALHGPQNIYIVLEGLVQDLFEFIETYQHVMNDNICGVVLREAASGLAHMHSRRVAHRDLKSENILVEFSAQTTRACCITVKICDFGLSRFLPEVSSMLHDFAGSPGFFAPEVHLHSAFCGLRADVFSFAAVCLEMLVSQTFFLQSWMPAYASRAKDPHSFSLSMREAIAAAHLEIRRHHCPAEVQEVLNNALTLNASERPTIASLAHSPWFVGANADHACDVLSNKIKLPRKLPIPSGLPIASKAVCIGALPRSIFPSRQR